MDWIFLGTTQLPNNLTYAIRFPERPRLNTFFGYGGRSWRTENSFPLFELPGPRFPYSWEGGNDPGLVYFFYKNVCLILVIKINIKVNVIFNIF